MRRKRFWAVAVIVAAGAISGLLWLAPTTYGQTEIRVPEHSIHIPSIDALVGRASSIGVVVRDLEASEEATLQGTRGVMIQRVEDDSPAAKAGFTAGDIVIAFDGESIRSARQFSRLVAEARSDRQVKATVVRNGARVDLDVTPRERGFGADWSRDRERREGRTRVVPGAPALESLPELRMELDEAFGRRTLGVQVHGLSDELAAYFGVKEGVLVNTVRSDSPAAKAGLKAGDVITHVNGRTIDDASELRRRVREASADTVTLDVVRDKKPMTLQVTRQREERQTSRWF